MSALVAVAAALAESQVRQVVLALLLAAVIGLAVALVTYGVTSALGRPAQRYAVAVGCVVAGVALLLLLLY